MSNQTTFDEHGAGFPVTILPNQGLGHILFGADPDSVLRDLGTPSADTELSRTHMYLRELSYDHVGCEFDFSDGIWNPSLAVLEMPSLVWITVADPRFTLFGQPVVGSSESNVLNRLAEYATPREITDKRERRRKPFDKELYYSDLRLSIYLNEGTVTEVVWRIPDTGPAPFLTRH